MYIKDPSNPKFKLLTAFLFIFLFGSMSHLKAQTCYVSIYPSIASNLTVDFSSFGSGTGSVNYSWDFDDGTFNSQKDVTHTFASAGNYNVCLSMTDTSGCTSVACRELTLAGTSCNTPEIETSFYEGIDGSFVLPAIFDQSYANIDWALTNTATGAVLATGNNRWLYVTFSDPGAYQACATADLLDANGDFICTINQCEQFTVTLPPYVYSLNRTIGPDYEVNYSLVEQNGGPLPTEIEWMVGNDPVGVNGSATLSQTYPGPGNYGVRIEYSTPGTNIYGIAYASVSLENPNGSSCDLPINVSYANNVATLSFYPPTNSTANNIVWQNSSNANQYTNPASFAVNGNPYFYLNTDLIHDDGSSCQTYDEFYFDTDCYSAINHNLVNDSTVTFEVGFPNNANIEVDSIGWRIIAPDNTETFSQLYPFDYTFSESGFYTVCQESRNNICYSQNCEQIYLGDITCDYQADGPVTETTYESGTYTLSSITGAQVPDEITWYVIGQTGFIGSGQTIDHTFLEHGIYDVCADYSVVGTTCIGTECTTVTIEPACDYRIEYNSNGNMYSIQGLNGSVTPDSVIWYLDGSWIGTGASLNYNFPLGTYPVCASYFVDGTSCIAEVCSVITFTPQSCGSQSTGAFYVEDYDYNLILFTGAADIETVEWYLSSDGTVIGSGANYVHSFPAVGLYEVCADFTVVGEPACAGTSCTLVNVTEITPCAFDFVYSSNADSTYTFEMYNPQNISLQTFEWTYEEVSTGETDIYYDNPLNISFETAGYYEICATSFYQLNAYCNVDTCKLILIENSIPCNYNVDVAIGTDSFNYDFSLVHSNPDPSMIYAYWTVDNAYKGTGLNFSYDFVAAGSYEVCVNYDPSNQTCQGSSCTTVTVTDPATTCDLAFSFTTDGSMATFVGYDQLGGELAALVDWSFYDYTSGNTLYQTNSNDTTNYFFANTGDYDVCLTAQVTYANGDVCSDSVCETITLATTPTCTVDYEYTIANDSIIDFTANLPLGAATDLGWTIVDQADGSTVYANSSTDLADTAFAYVFPYGSYEVCFNYGGYIGSDFCTNTYCEIITIAATFPCYADLSYTISNDTIGDFIIYAPQNINIDSFYWNVTDQSTGQTDINIVNDGSTTFDYVFPSEGNYEVCIDVALYSPIDYCNYQTCELITIGVPSCEISIGYVMMNDSVGIFSATPSQGYYTDSLVWTFTHLSSGAVATQVDLDSVTIYDFPNTGLYEVCVDADLYDLMDYCNTSSCTQVLIGSPSPPCVIDYDYSINANDVGSFEVLPNTSGSYSNVTWLVTAGGVTASGTGSPFTYIFNNPGTYQVCVQADVLDSDGSFVCQADECKTVTVGSTATCAAEFAWAEIIDAMPTYGVYFENFSTNYSNAFWEFGDGNVSYSTDDFFSHEYQNAGNYQACLTVWDTLTNCQASYCDLITINAMPNCDYDIELTVNGSVATAEFIIYNGNNPDTIIWYDPVSNEQFGNGNSIIHIYNNPGTYTICADFQVVGTSCFGTLCEELTIANPSCANTDCVFPGDADYDQIANNFDLLAIGLEFGKTGPPRLNASNDWYGQPAIDWTTNQTNGINTKHSDCNGDGLIDFDDVDVINYNYDRTHNGVAPTNFAAMSDIYIDFEKDTIPLDPNDPNSFLITAHIMVGNDKMPAEDFYGVAFTMNYPPGLVRMGSTEMLYDNNSWLGTDLETIDLDVDFYAEGELDLAFSRIDQVSVNGYGRVATVYFVVTDNIIGKGLNEIPFNVSITDVKAIDEEGQLIPMGTVNAATLIVFEDIVGIKPVEEVNFEVFPNPASTLLQVELPRAEKQQITLYNTLGQIVFEAKATAKITSINVEKLTTGIYFLQVKTEEGEVTKKVIVK